MRKLLSDLLLVVVAVILIFAAMYAKPDPISFVVLATMLVGLRVMVEWD